MTLKSIFESIINFDLSNLFNFLLKIIFLLFIVYVFYYFISKVREEFKTSSLSGKIQFIVGGIFLICLLPTFIIMLIS
ncbi:cytochrome c oxidase assembly factor CtaG [Polynucleobacter sphagniphilus]|nr:cytochrome c oxidase assembly factor CtaG [Polynucleobacter sphagniphilus]